MKGECLKFKVSPKEMLTSNKDAKAVRQSFSCLIKVPSASNESVTLKETLWLE